ncbi:hypothetical protein CHX26_09620 [Porphyrobacter sp. HT-58-2]|uniref:hypothetical protein n=1 Tax=Porphyrobacter sp. HT-58-2 TaxID=2023229 RepID=UPI000CDCA285|nr:hypothetical protein [Porphyrobacter sp. HT-58-2]AUX69724.1 hypothetical protein CHX26_09620 [Porphyrobacter sp. HT-58-2]
MAQRIALGVYVVCFAIGTISHALDFWVLGLRPYQGAPIVLEAFWSSLVVLDPIAAGLLLSGKRRAGLVLAAIIMVCDVAANGYAFFVLGIEGFAVALLLQAAFLGFVLGSIGFLWGAEEPGA